MSARQNSEFKEIVSALAEEQEDLPHLKNLSRRDRKAAETRIRLFRCALQLFADRGFPNVTVEDITEAADVGKGTFFNYFASKDHVLGVMAEIQIGKVREALAQAESGKESVRSILHNLLQRLAAEPGRSPDLARALVTSLLASKDVRELVDAHMAQGRRFLARIFEIGQERGEIDSQLNTAQLSRLLQQSVLGGILLWSLMGEPKLKAAMEQTFQHFWRGLAPESER
jgi:AcrR family transcriptional regulator